MKKYKDNALTLLYILIAVGIIWSWVGHLHW